MPVLIPLILLTILFVYTVRGFWQADIAGLQTELDGLTATYEEFVAKARGLKAENEALAAALGRTTALYDITKDMCTSLDPTTITALFKAGLSRFMTYRDCVFLRGEDFRTYEKDGVENGVVIVPVHLQKKIAGSLIAGGIKDEDKDHFMILAQQFILAIRRALLYERVHELVVYDPATQTLSRRSFMERFRNEFMRCERLRHGMTFLMVDIDNFKKINDKYGHLVGDRILREISIQIRDMIRQIDFIGRYGGEELSVVLGETGKEQAWYIAERIRAAIESQVFQAYDETLHATVSIGTASYPEDAREGKDLIDKADRALYKAKASGRNQVCAI